MFFNARKLEVSHPVEINGHYLTIDGIVIFDGPNSSSIEHLRKILLELQKSLK